jgi:membrane-associated PAP2 superfamily phosphatase
MKTLEFWRQHLLLPIGLALAFFATAVAWGYDLALGHVFYLGDHWIGTERWWVDTLLHRSAQNIVIGSGVLAALAWLASWHVEALRRWRRPLGYYALNLALATGLVALIKSVSGIPCPWSLREFGGTLPVTTLVDAFQGSVVKGGGCFPASHAACGYSFVSLYFIARDARPRLAPVALAAAIGIGIAFGITQQSLGAHLITHDIASAALCWLVALGLYVFAFDGNLAPASSRDVAAQVRVQRLPSVLSPRPPA